MDLGRNDLWKFNGVNWTWVAGNNSVNAPAVLGTKGIPDKTNTPAGSRGVIHWTDQNDNLWLFSGFAECKLIKTG